VSDTPRLEDFHREYAPRRFPGALSRRGQQALAKRLRLPLIRAGHSVLIDPDRGDERLRELAIGAEPQQPRRGRPRTDPS
jgi:hypothetical protein